MEPTTPSNNKRWHRAFPVQRQLALIDAARQHDPLKDFPGKIMFDTIRTLSEICDEQEKTIIELENRKVFDDFDDEAYSDS